jgi:hypothetical protein
VGEGRKKGGREEKKEGRKGQQSKFLREIQYFTEKVPLCLRTRRLLINMVKSSSNGQ